MSKNILIDTTNTKETRIAVLENEKLDDFEIESNKKTAVKGDVYLAKITRIEPSLQAAFVDFGGNRNGFLPLTEIHPDYFKIPAADEKKIKELGSKIFNKENLDDDLVDNEKNDELNDNKNEDLKDELVEDENTRSEKPKFKNKKLSPKKEYFNLFRKKELYSSSFRKISELLTQKVGKPSSNNAMKKNEFKWLSGFIKNCYDIAWSI